MRLHGRTGVILKKRSQHWPKNDKAHYFRITRRLGAHTAQIGKSLRANEKRGHLCGESPGLSCRFEYFRVVDAKKQPTTRLAAEQMSRDIKRAEMRILYSRTALILAALGLFITGAISHKRRSFFLGEADDYWYWQPQSATGADQCSSALRQYGAGPVVLPTRYNSLSGQQRLRDDAYSDFRLAQGFTRFIESDGVPAEATVVDHTWRYVNKNGGPDTALRPANASTVSPPYNFLRNRLPPALLNGPWELIRLA